MKKHSYLKSDFKALFHTNIIIPSKRHKKKLIGIFIILVLGIFISLYYTPLSTSINNIDANSYSGGNLSNGYILLNGKIINESGYIVHKWSNTTEDSRLGVILQNGEYIGKFGKSWRKYSWNGTLLWESNENVPHHMISLTSDNRILTIIKEYHEYQGENVGFDVGLEYDINFNIINRWSTWDNLKEIQSYHKGLDSLSKPHKDASRYDYYHMNAIKEIPSNENSKYEIIKNNKTIRPFEKGNWIISFRQGSILLILDKNTKEIVWSLIGDSLIGSIDGQHDPTMLENGNILIYDNGLHRNSSRIIELNPITMEIEWEYSRKDFFALSRGTVQSMPNENILVLEGRNGMMYEINKNKEIVWEYTHIPDKNHVQTIFYAKKHSKEFIEQFL